MNMIANIILLFFILNIACTSKTEDDTESTSSTDESESFSVNTPANFETILEQSVSLTPSNKTSVSNYDRILLKSGNNYMGSDSDFGIILDDALSTMSDLLSKTFFLVEEEGESCYRMDSELHGIYSVDYNSQNGNLKLSNAWGYDRDSSSGFLCFTFDAAGNSLTASKRFQFNESTSSYDQDNAFTAQQISFSSTSGLATLSNTGSSISFQDSGFAFTIPDDFNPEATNIVDNDRVKWESLNIQSYSENNLSGDKTYKDTYTSYQAQVETAGYDSDTAAAAEEMLSQIKSDLEAEGSSLRYDPEVYLAFRTAMLKTTLTAANIVNGEIGQNTVPYVYFTNETDDDGVYHPFMVIATYSISDKPNHLLDVPQPPGDGAEGTSYPEQDVTRDAVLQTYTLKIPLKDYGNVDDFTDNEMDNTLADDVNETSYTVYNYASVNYIGIAVDGVVIYPPLNNTLATAQTKAEITFTGIHVGRGMGLHWHADGHGATGNGLNLYNLPDYEDQSHPPLIGFGMDGIALYGKYEDDYSTMDGFDEALDSFGAHSHGSYGTHYHAHSEAASVLGDSKDYTVHIFMKGAWKGAINDVPEFWSVASQINRYVGNSQSNLD